MSYVIKTLKSKISVSILIMLLCMIFSSIAIYVSVQMSYDYWQKIDYGDVKNKQVIIDIVYNNKKIFTKADLIYCLERIDSSVLNRVDMIATEAYDNNKNLSLTNVYYSDLSQGIDMEYLGSYNVVPFYFTYIDGEILNSNYIRDLFVDINVFDKEDYLTDKHFKNAEKVALVDDTLNAYYRDKDTITLFEQEYEIIGKFKNINLMNTIIPFTTIPDNTELKVAVTFDFQELIKVSDYNEIVSVFTENFPDVTRPAPLEISSSNKSFYITVLISSIIIAVISLVNFWIINKNMFEKNNKKYMIYRICGATKATIILKHTLHCIMTTLISLLLGYLIYSTIIEKMMSKYNTYIYPHQNILFLIMIALFTVITGIYSLIICLTKIRKYPLLSVKEGAI